MSLMEGKKLLFVAFILALVLISCSTSGTNVADNLENIGIEENLVQEEQVPDGYNRVVFYWEGSAELATSDV